VITVYNILQVLRDALAKDAAIQTWCSALYARPHVVAVGWDVRAPFSESDCPGLLLLPNAHRFGQDVATRQPSVILAAFVHDALVETPVISGSIVRVREARGVRKAEELAMLAWSSAVAAMASKSVSLGLADMTFDYPATPADGKIPPPVWSCSMTVTVTVPTLIGAELTL
jgi:hypothetical protein